jgi:hypothetical protein
MAARSSVTAVLATATPATATAACGSTSTSGASSETVTAPPRTSAHWPEPTLIFDPNRWTVRRWC